MEWLLIYFSLGYSGSLGSVEFSTEKECLAVKQQLEQTVKGVPTNRALICVKREPKYNVPEYR